MRNKKAVTSGRADCISQLPDELLHHVLALLPVDEAVQTSALARRWRHLWKRMPVLRLVDPRRFASAAEVRQPPLSPTRARARADHGGAWGRGGGAEAAVQPRGRPPDPAAAGGVARDEHTPQRRRPPAFLRHRRGPRRPRLRLKAARSSDAEVSGAPTAEQSSAVDAVERRRLTSWLSSARDLVVDRQRNPGAEDGGDEAQRRCCWGRRWQRQGIGRVRRGAHGLCQI